MKMLLASLFLLTSCSWFNVGCVVQSNAVKIATDAVVATLQCENQEAVHADLDAIVSKVGLCKTSYQTGLIGETVCPIVSGAVVQFLAENAIPANWGCKATDAKQKLGDALLTACKAVPVSKE